MRHTGITRAKRDRLYEALYESQMDLGELAGSERLSLARLAQWASDPETISALDGLCRLNDVRAQMLVSRYRTLAAARLFELAKSDDGGELARRACVDLLKVSLVNAVAPAAAATNVTTAGSGSAGLDETTARRLFALAGQEHDGPTSYGDACGESA